MKIKLNSLVSKADRIKVLRQRRAKAERAAALRSQRVSRPSEFITHVRLLDVVHPDWRGAYSVAVRGTALRSEANVKLEHRFGARS
jgi:hypothetical protein